MAKAEKKPKGYLIASFTIHDQDTLTIIKGFIREQIWIAV
jgi:hypothetical protein